MSIKRIKELQDYADDFYKKLQASEESCPNEDEKFIFSYNKIIKKSFSNYNIMTKTKLKPIMKRNDNKLNIYNTLTPWVPPSYEGDYFEGFKRLQDHYDMNGWEKVILKI